MKLEEKNKVNFNKYDPRPRVKSFFSQDFFKNSLVHWTLISAIFLNIANWSITAFFIRPTEVEIILHYNVYFGVDIVGMWWQAYLLPAVGTVFMVVNTILAYLLFSRRERIAAHLFLLASFIIQAGTLIAIASIAQINY